MDTDKVWSRLHSEPGSGYSVDALAEELALDAKAVDAALDSLKSQGLVKRSIGGNWFVPKPLPALEPPTPPKKGAAKHTSVHPEHLPGTQQVWLIHAPNLASDTVLHLSFRDGSGRYRLRRYVGEDPSSYGKGYEAPGAKTVTQLVEMYGPILREADFTADRPNYTAVIAWGNLVRDLNKKWGIPEKS